MRFGSVCSGIEAASVAWGPLGWKAAWFSEIEPFPSAVLAHHYPETPNLGDMTRIPALLEAGEVEAPDILCGGTPCQAFSVASLRRSLDDARGNLSLTFCEIANAIDAVRLARGELPAVVFWENVPGVLSTADNAFGCFLAGLAGDDQPAVAPRGKWKAAGVVVGPERLAAWRVLDAQFFGVAQRRRRVFVVSVSLRHPRAWAIAESILPVVEGVRRDSAPSREAREGTAQSAAASAAVSSGHGYWLDAEERAATLRAQDSVTKADTLVTQPYAVGNTLTARMHKGINTTLDEGQTPVLAHALRGEGFDASEDGTGRGTPLVPVGVTLHGTDGTQSVASFTDLSSSLRARIPSGVENSTTTAVMQPVAVPMINMQGSKGNAVAQADGPSFTLNAMHGHDVHAVLAPTLTATNDPSRSPQSSEVTAQVAAVVQATAALFIQDDTTPKVNEERAGCLRRDAGGEGACVMTPAMQVRRLTPVECERLQGFPDDYTAIPWRGKPAAECPDGPRYKALGNSWAVPVVRWIGQRIQEAL